MSEYSQHSLFVRFLAQLKGIQECQPQIWESKRVAQGHLEEMQCEAVLMFQQLVDARLPASLPIPSPSPSPSPSPAKPLSSLRSFEKVALLELSGKMALLSDWERAANRLWPDERVWQDMADKSEERLKLIAEASEKVRFLLAANELESLVTEANN